MKKSLSLWVLVFVLIALLFPGGVRTVRAGHNYQPSYGAAVVDGDPGEWDRTLDYYAAMYKAGKPDKGTLAELYLRYDCQDGVLYALVLAASGLEVITTPLDNAFIKKGNSVKLVDANDSPPDGVLPDFAWVGLSTDGSRALGWEAAVSMPEPVSNGFFDIPNLNVHTNVYADGESQTAQVADAGILLQVICTDCGDLPAEFGITLTADDGPVHWISDLRLGELIDGELDGFEDPSALGDDLDARTDEDGILRYPDEAWKPGATVHLTATVSGGSGYLVGWFDWNNDKILGPAELLSFGQLTAGKSVLSLVVSDGYTQGHPLFVRFRLYPQAPASPLPTGEVDGGEVEDYLWLFQGTAVHLADFDVRPTADENLVGVAVVVSVAVFLLLGTWWVKRAWR